MKPIKNKTSQITTDRREYKFVTNDKMKEPYYDEGWSYIKHSPKLVYAFQARAFRSWKHNRKTQWKT